MDRSPELPDIVLDVRPISQHGLFATVEPTDNRACWYASAMMVLNYRGPLPHLELINLRSLARLWKNHGVQPHHLDQLAAEAGLELSPARAILPTMGPGQWSKALSTLGPLMIVLSRRHMIVVRGIVKRGAGWEVVYNDPFIGDTRSEALLRFNGGVDWRMPVLFKRSTHRAPSVLQQPVNEPYRVAY
jgi:hypothetical protein